MRIASTPAPGPSTAEPTNEGAWLVKVVRREAQIGRHTFRLQEIYGLASSSSAAPAEPAPTTYPPTPAQNNVNDGPATECVLCLSSPREVVLLPCRHLVACRECAVNMVEFGAGGALTHEVEPTEATTATATEAPAEGTAAAETTATPAAPAPVIPAPSRRKRKAKGWFCPVCRQRTPLLQMTIFH